MKLNYFSGILALVFLLISNFLFADINHYNNILVGDRSSAMGGAYIALSDDASGTYYNPSGIAFYNGGTLSATVNVYHLQFYTYEGAIRNNDWKRNSQELIPNFFGVIKSWDKNSLGVSIAVPDSFVQHQDQVFNDLPGGTGFDPIKKYVFNLHTSDSSYLIGPSYSYKINDSLAVGLTMSVHYRKARTQNYQSAWYSNLDTDSEMSSYIGDITEFGIAPKLGFMARVSKKVNLGITLGKVFITSSKFALQTNQKSRGSNELIFNEATTKLKRNTATQLGLGFAFFPNEALVLSLDLNIYFAPKADAFFPTGYKNVLNFAIGSEYSFNQRHSARLGFFSNYSNMPEPSTNTALVTKLNTYGISTGYCFKYKPTSFHVGIVYSAGSGKSQVYSDTSSIVNVKNSNVTGLISTSYEFN